MHRSRFNYNAYIPKYTIQRRLDSSPNTHERTKSTYGNNDMLDPPKKQ